MHRLVHALILCAALLADGARAQDAKDLARWHRLWAAGRIDLDAVIDDVSAAARIYGDLPQRATRPLRHRDALALLLDRVRAEEGYDAVRALLLVAATGLDGRAVDAALAPHVVRELAHAALVRLDRPAAVDVLLRAAGPAEREAGIRVAALLALGGVAFPVVRITVERQLGDRERLVRLAAAEALAERGHEDSLDELAAQLAAEEDAVVAQALVLAVHRVVRERGAAADATATRRAVLAAIDALGRTDWRADLAIVELLEDARTTQAIPALIDVLARFTGDARREASALLRERAHEVLQSLTGTRIRIDDVGGWRAFWEREKAGFMVAARPPGRSDPGATTTGFFGIPVRGSRIVFAIDVSGSMKAKLGPLTDTATSADAGDVSTRLQVAKRELWNAVRALPGDARFGVVVFSSGVRRWSPSLVPSTPNARANLHGMLAELSPAGATDLWGALDAALGLSGQAWGEIDAGGADEVFLLTDGLPSAGDLTAPDAIADAVREANRYRRVRIHAVSLGGDAAFLRRLAEENGGTFVQR